MLVNELVKFPLPSAQLQSHLPSPDCVFYLSSSFNIHAGGSEVKASDSNTGDLGSIPGSGRSPVEGNGNPLQYSCLKNLMERGAWQATVHGVPKSQTRLSDLTLTLTVHWWSLITMSYCKSNEDCLLLEQLKCFKVLMCHTG